MTADQARTEAKKISPSRTSLVAEALCQQPSLLTSAEDPAEVWPSSGTKFTWEMANYMLLVCLFVLIHNNFFFFFGFRLLGTQISKIKQWWVI